MSFIIENLKSSNIIPRTWFPRKYKTPRVVMPRMPNDYPDNYISNTKYTIFTFVFHNLFEQFRSHMNKYFFVIACLQLWSEVTPVNPVTTWAPLLCAMALTALKAAIDDIRRFLSDRQLNTRKLMVVRNREFQPINSKNVRVGDIVRLENNDEIPCDMVLIGTSGDKGVAYIQTANLDGETDLKARVLPKDIQKFIEKSRAVDIESLMCRFPGMVTCPPPDPQIYKFDAHMELGSKKVSLSADQLLLQSCHIKNTETVYGLVVYTGNETKCGKNKRPVPTKNARIDRKMDLIAVCVFIFQFFIVFVMGLAGTLVQELDIRENDSYLNFGTQRPWYWFIIIPARFLLLITYMVPLSLKITMDIMKSFYAIYVANDIEMYDEDIDMACVARNTNIIEDLGQIEFVLTDKTGTLTQNVMVFQQCSIANLKYGSPEEPAMKHKKLIKCVRETNSKEQMFFRALALCHTCTRKENEDGVSIYASPSPDEEALVKAARDVGVELIDANSNYYMLNVNGALEKWNQLHVLKFTSDRRRMSLILEHEKSGKVYLFIKGADDKILERLTPNVQTGIVCAHIDAFARDGLRTLLVGYKEIPAEEYQAWKNTFHEASLATDNRDDLLTKVYADIEKNLQLCGCTAVEDKLQEEVESSIQKLRDAGIRVWMLTGDKFETAKQIGRTCNLVSDEFPLLAIFGGEDDMERLKQTLDEAKDQVQLLPKGARFSMIIEGKTLQPAFEHFKKQFREIAMKAETVICCRVSPKQKAMIVKLVKKQKKQTLAIGDGGNDVPMIQEAHVGVGIAGKEGLQASRAADFAFGKFKFLIPLMFVHGHYAHNRSSFMVKFSFYKNIVLALCQVLYNAFTGLSGQSPYNSLSLTLFNFLWTAYTFMMIFDYDVTRDELKTQPYLYEHTKSGRSISVITSLLWFAMSLVHTTIILLFTVYSNFPHVLPFMGGAGHDIEYTGHILFGNVLWVILGTYFILNQSINAIAVIVIFITMFIYYVFLCLYSNALNVASFIHLIPGVDPFSIVGVINQLMMDPVHYLVTFLVVTTCAIIVLAVAGCTNLFFPSIINRYFQFRSMHKKSIKKHLQDYFFTNHYDGPVFVNPKHQTKKSGNSTMNHVAIKNQQQGPAEPELEDEPHYMS